MEINVTLWDKDADIDNVQQLKYTNTKDSYHNIRCWLEEKDFNKSVFVCFVNKRGLSIEDVRNEQISFLISHSLDEIENFLGTTLSYFNSGDDFVVVEFNNYQEAFEYCIDLKEGF